MNFKLIVAIYLGVIWLLNGLIINVFQLLNYVAIRPFNVDLSRRINYYLLYTSWSQVVALAEWWTGLKLRFFFADDRTEKMFGREHNLVVLNHRYELDWLICWMVTDKYEVLGSSKCFAKKSLKWSPIVGWAWIFGEMIFLERNWDKDQKTLGKSLDMLMEYVDKCTILLFCEGTRFTEEKYEASVQFAEKKGWTPLKYHLLPRARGFNYCVKHLKGTLPAVYNIQLAMRGQTDAPPTFLSLFSGQPCTADLYFERIAVEDIPTDNEAETTQFLNDMYKKKDDLTEFYEKTGNFPGKLVCPKRRIAPLMNSIFWVSTMTSGIIFLIRYLIAIQNYTLLYSISILILSGFMLLVHILRTTRAKRGSSYGMAKVEPISGKQSKSNHVTSDASDVRKRIINGTTNTK